MAAPAKRRPATDHARRTVFVATSLDGFIARENGALDWLPHPSAADSEDYGYASLIRRTDALVMGRATFDTVMGFGSWPYGNLPVIVLTHRPLRLPARFAGAVEAMRGRPATVVARLTKRGLKRLYIDGGQTIQDFLRAGVIDEVIVTRVPVLLGRGIPLFGPGRRDIRLRHRRTRAYKSGLVQSTYDVL